MMRATLLGFLLAPVGLVNAWPGHLLERAALVDRSYQPVNGGCMPGHTLCEVKDRPESSYCTNLKIDANNCGACSASCIGGYGRCIDGQCPGNITCGEGLTRCWGGSDNQVETHCVDLKTDRNNCGGCQGACPPGYGCQGGTCVVDPNDEGPDAPWYTGVCQYPLRWCEDRFGFGNGCVNFQNDNRNCGRCQFAVRSYERRC